MALRAPGLPPASSLTSPSSGTAAPARESASAGRFGQVWAQVAPEASATVKVQRGDTLIGLVKAQQRQQGQPISDHRAYRLAHQIAADNRIANPDLIHPGQNIDFSRLKLPVQATQTSPPPGALEVPMAAKIALEQIRPAAPGTPGAVASTAHPVLDQVLQRAVGKGFIPGADLGGVRTKILELADKYRFEPDDFARLSLLESGGMNPQASNGHCHGVIQFCDGPARGAAAVGYGGKPQAILGMSLLKQLDLVDRYFSKVGMPDRSDKQGLDELYLAILSPAARQERRPDAPLPIAGSQASLLHVGRDTRNPITRASLIAGLQAVTDRVLSPLGGRKSPARLYAEVAEPPTPSQGE